MVRRQALQRCALESLRGLRNTQGAVEDNYPGGTPALAPCALSVAKLHHPVFLFSHSTVLFMAASRIPVPTPA